MPKPIQKPELAESDRKRSCQVLYGDTDSMFVRLPGRSKVSEKPGMHFQIISEPTCQEEAFKEGARIAREA